MVALIMLAPTVKTTKQLRSHIREKRIPLDVVKELVRRTFSDCDRVTVGLLSKGGFSPAVLLLARGSTRGGRIPIQPQAIKVGPQATILKESRRFRKHVRNLLRGVPSQTRAVRVYKRWAVLPYWQIGDGVAVQTLRDFYDQADAETIIAVWSTLFDGVMAPWLRNIPTAERHIFRDRTHCYGISARTLAQIRTNARSLSSGLASFDPVTAWGVLRACDQLPALVYEPLIHGDLNSTNVLIDRASRPWVIDFAHTGPGHYLRDLAKLEAEIKFLLMNPQGDRTRIPDWLELDRALDDRWPFGRIPPPGFRSTQDRELAKAFISICGLRAIARDRMLGPKPPQISQYRAALLHFTLQVITYKDVSHAKKEYAIHSAFRLCQFKYNFSASAVHV